MKNNILLLCGALIVTCVVLEIALRVFDIAYPYFTRIDFYTGHSLRPHAQGWQRDEGEAYVHMNSAGLRDREYEKEKPEGVVRIAVLGDSYAEARQVTTEDAFWSVMEQKLNICASRIEVINFGVSGFSTAQELEMLRSRVWEYDPDIVLLAFFAGNDVRNNSHTLSQHDREPYYLLENEELVLDTSFRETQFFRFQQSLFARSLHILVNHSRILQIANRARKALQVSHVPSVNNATLWAPAAWGEDGIDIAIYTPPVDPAWQEAWDITERIISLMHDEVTERGAQFLLTSLSTSIQTHPDLRQELLDHLKIDNLFYPERRLADLGAREGFPVLALAPLLQADAEQRGFLHGFANTTPGKGHWNSLGHRLAGKHISQYICDRLL